MEKEFIPYEEALTLKELGFDEQCLGFWDIDEKFYYEHLIEPHLLDEGECAVAPLYQQAFRWLQEKSFNEDGDSLVQDYLDTRWFRTLFSPVHQDITLRECIRIFKENL